MDLSYNCISSYFNLLSHGRAIKTPKNVCRRNKESHRLIAFALEELFSLTFYALHRKSLSLIKILNFTEGVSLVQLS